ncbi:MAG: hypothetical protein KC777_30005 [Cyanobacteria bacterium HKST-UBA02]|nr:hypothetical protein [Cyanobacteria bacterium HKST-UBA02]
MAHLRHEGDGATSERSHLKSGQEGRRDVTRYQFADFPVGAADMIALARSNIARYGRVGGIDQLYSMIFFAHNVVVWTLNDFRIGEPTPDELIAVEDRYPEWRVIRMLATGQQRGFRHDLANHANDLHRRGNTRQTYWGYEGDKVDGVPFIGDTEAGQYCSQFLDRFEADIASGAVEELISLQRLGLP